MVDACNVVLWGPSILSEIAFWSLMLTAGIDACFRAVRKYQRVSRSSVLLGGLRRPSQLSYGLFSAFLRGNRIPHRKLVVPGSLQGMKVFAIPDTGSDANIVSETFARQLSPTINTQACRTLRFADGGKGRTVGQMTLEWSFLTEPEQ